MNKKRTITGLAAAVLLLGSCATTPAAPSGTGASAQAPSPGAALEPAAPALQPAGTVQPRLELDGPSLAGLAREAVGKDQESHNPLFTQRYAADPTALYWKGRVYVYTTGDVQEFDASGKKTKNTYSKVNTINVISSGDFVNWTDHGRILVAGDDGAASWAGNSWAPAIAAKNIDGKDRFFLYFANSANGIGVLAADSPLGPFKDPIEEPLVMRWTDNCRDIPWLFDPAVFIDTDGKAYLYFGGGVPKNKDEHPMSARVVELGPDMVSLAGTPVTIDAPWLFEDSGINKIGNTYVYTYCSNWSSRDNATGDDIPGKAEIIAMTGTSPLGPFTYKGSILRNPGSFFGGWGNNHHTIIQIDGEWYVFYHSFVLQDALKVTDGGYRSVHADKITLDANGNIEPITATREGLVQRKKFSPYSADKAGTMAWWGGSFEQDCSKAVQLQAGDWTGIAGVDFGSTGSSLVTVRVSASAEGSTLAVCLDGLDGSTMKCIGGIKVPQAKPGEDFVTLTAQVDKTSGVHDLFFLCSAGSVSFEAWSFSEGK